MDRFLTKMKARPKHMACISVSAFHIAAVRMAKLDADHLVSISQCKCTGGDLERMSTLIRGKLEWAPNTTPVTAITFLRLFHIMFHTAASQIGLGDLYANIVTESELLLRLEMVVCDGHCASLRPSEIALVLLCTYLDTAVNRLDANADVTSTAVASGSSTSMDISSVHAHQMLRLVEFASEVQKICNITDESFFATHELVSAILSKYNAQEQTPHRQRLIWRLSSRTARLLRPTDKFTSVLPVIAEHAPVPSPSRVRYILFLFFFFQYLIHYLETIIYLFIFYSFCQCAGRVASLEDATTTRDVKKAKIYHQLFLCNTTLVHVHWSTF